MGRGELHAQKRRDSGLSSRQLSRREALAPRLQLVTRRAGLTQLTVIQTRLRDSRRPDLHGLIQCPVRTESAAAGSAIKSRGVPGPDFDPPKASSPRRVRSEFASLKEWGDWVNANCAPRRADDTPVLMGQTGPRKRATRAELMEIIEEQRSRLAGHHTIRATRARERFRCAAARSQRADRRARAPSSLVRHRRWTDRARDAVGREHALGAACFCEFVPGIPRWLTPRSCDVTSVYEREHLPQQIVGDSVGFDQLLLD